MTLVSDFNSSVNVPFQRMRQMLFDGALQEGVVGANDLKVVQRGAGANQSVDVGTGFAWVQIDTGTRNGMGHVTNDATVNVVVTASNATNPRIDQIVLRWNDSSIPTGSGNVPTLEVVTGTPTGGATLDNRTGVAALPNDCLRLADILVPATSTSVTTANIRDRRPWARGAFSKSSRTAGDLTTGSATLSQIDAANLSPRVECSGVPLRVRLIGQIAHSVATGGGQFGLQLDGVAVDSTTIIWQTVCNTSGVDYGFIMDYTVVGVAVGSHLVIPTMATGAATLTLRATAAKPVHMTVEEIVRPNASNT